ETGLQLLGSLIGDHAKTAIGTLLATGTVVGTGANVFEAVRPPKYVPPFAWGATGGARMSRDGFLGIAERVLPRRDVAVDAGLRGSGRAGAAAARGSRRRRPAAPQHRHQLRPGRSGRAVVHRHGAGRRT